MQQQDLVNALEAAVRAVHLYAGGNAAEIEPSPNDIVGKGLAALLASGVPIDQLNDLFDREPLEAIRVRVMGEFDHSALQSYGPLADTAADISRIADNALIVGSPAVAGTYRVHWSIDSDAATPEEAAQEAWAAMRRSDSIANVFEVIDRNGTATTVDLDEPGAEDEDRPGMRP